MATRKPVDPLCPSIQVVLKLLSRRWTGLILAALQRGPLRFGELAGALPDIGDKILSARLKELEAQGLVERSVDAGRPVKVSYRLTPLGQGFGQVTAAIEGWGNAFLASRTTGRVTRRSA
jgi:DNA-binding HxlR family transcriptional regulator